MTSKQFIVSPKKLESTPLAKHYHFGLGVFCCVALALYFLWFSIYGLPSHLLLARVDSGVIQKVIGLPFESSSNGRVAYRATFGLRGNFLAPSKYFLHVDDCVESITVNDQPLNLDIILPVGRCSWGEGSTIDLAGHLSRTDNVVVINFVNERGRTLFNLQVSPWDVRAGGFFSLAFLSSVLLLLLVLRRLGLTRVESLPILVGLSFIIYYASHTSPWERTYDVLEGGGHIDYILYVLNNLSFPDPRDGWQYKHPPLYYMVSALIWYAAGLVNPLISVIAVRYLGILAMVGVLTISALTMRRVIKTKLCILPSFAVCLWPSTILHAGRIGNDAFSFFFTCLAWYLLLVWKDTKQEKHFHNSLMAGCLALLSKNTALYLLPLYFILIVSARHELSKSSKISSIIYLALAFILDLGDNIWVALTNAGTDWLNTSVGSLHSGLRVSNSLFNFIYIDVRGFLETPFASTWKADGLRDMFWHFFLKSSLFGEFSFEGKYIKGLAQTLSLLVLIKCIFVASLLFRSNLKEFSERLTLWAWLFVPFVALLYFRISSPFSPHADFRYCYPIIIPAVCLFFLSVDGAKNRYPFIWGLGFFVSIIFPIVSALFFMQAHL